MRIIKQYVGTAGILIPLAGALLIGVGIGKKDGMLLLYGFCLFPVAVFLFLFGLVITRCQACKKRRFFIGLPDHKEHYCPFCGARHNDQNNEGQGF